jgi:hypothetical protein
VCGIAEKNAKAALQSASNGETWAGFPRAPIWNRASVERCYACPMPAPRTPLPLTPLPLESVLQGLHDSEIRCDIQNEPPARETPPATDARIARCFEFTLFLQSRPVEVSCASLRFCCPGLAYS